MSIDSIGSIKDHTPNYKLIIPRFDLATWHDYIEENFRNIDALFFNLFGINNYSGSWKQITEYTQGQVLFIGDDLDINGNVTEFSGRLVKVLVDHVTDNSDYFNVFYNLHPEYYELFADASTAQVYAQQAQSYKNETEILKNETNIIKEETNSIKNDTNLIKSDVITKQNEINNTISSFNEDFSEKSEQITQQIEDGRVIIAQETAVSTENVEKSRIWAEGEQAEVETLGGTLSSRGHADLAMAIANADEDTPIDASGLIALDVIRGPKGDKGDPGKDGGGLEIGDIAPTVFGIDETKNLRRYLNGQVISQSQFVSFTNIIKERANLYPNIVTTEENWQAEVTNSVLGQSGKFVIDDILGTIRLPKVVNINGLQDLALMGSIKAESLPNITGSIDDITGGASLNSSGAFNLASTYTYAIQSGSSAKGGAYSFDASRSSSTYQDNAPVQQEAIQYPYFIQVATGTEESVDVTREIELNNPFFFGMSQYFESEPNNASWLISNGSFHSGATYVSFYEWLLKIYNGTEIVDGVSVKASTDTYDDYDYVINTAYTTFRLPIRTASDYVIKSKESTVEDSSWYRVYKSGWVEQGGSELNAVNEKVITLLKAYKDVNYKVLTTGRSSANRTINVTERTTQNFKVSPRNYTDGTSTTTYDWIAVGQGAEIPNSKTYFYVGEIIQDANVVNASGVLTRVANSIDRTVASDREIVIRWGIPDYSSGIAITYPDSSHKFTAPCDGIIVLFNYWSGANNFSSDTILYINGVKTSFRGQSGASYYENGNGTIVAYLSKDDEIYLSRSARSVRANTFYPLKGAN